MTSVRVVRRVAIGLLCALPIVHELRAAEPQASRAADSAGPQAPVPPAVISRDEAGRTVVRAVRLGQPLRVDGRLDEAVYREIPSISDFIQTLPLENATPTEKTEAWVMFDADYIYISARCWDSAPPAQWTANEIRRDTSQLRQNDNFGVVLDTFHDGRNGYLFYSNPIGGFADIALTDEGNPNPDWNPVWAVRTDRFEGGWAIEMAIPFKSIRYRSGTSEIWGIQLRRTVRRKNEWMHLTRLPISSGGAPGVFRISAAATLVGLDLPPAGKNIEIKPYGISRVVTDRAAGTSNDPDGDVGVDFKYGLSANLTADLTYNTDFAQAEIDEQQVNLTRFSLFFPEKREFFLEGRGIFDFGRGGAGVGGGTGGGGSTGLTPSLFYSRRIGLNNNRAIPIEAGGRLTGKVGQFAVGVLNIQTQEERVSATPSTNFSVVRIKRDILRRSSIGGLVTNRSNSTIGDGANQAYGADAAFSFFENLSFGGYLSQTNTPGLDKDDISYQARFDYGADRYGARFEHLLVGENFNPEVGFVRRKDMRRSFGSLRFSPRPKANRLVRRFLWEASLEYLENGAGVLETRQDGGRFNIELESSDLFSIEATRNYELLPKPFSIARNVTIPAGGYDFNDVTVSYSFGQQRRASGNLSVQMGELYDGTIKSINYSGARVSITKQLSVEPSLSVNRLELPAGSSTTRVLRARSDYGFSPRMFVSGLVQFSSADNAFSSNLRFRWEYLPGSEIFFVYTDERDTTASGFPLLRNRAFVVKINRLLRF